MLSVEFSLFNIKQQARLNSPLIAGAALPSKMSQTSFSIREGAISNSYFLEEERLFHTYLITGRVSHHQGPISKVQAKSPAHCQQCGEKDLGTTSVRYLKLLGISGFTGSGYSCRFKNVVCVKMYQQLKHKNSLVYV
jgi:hypothetical protein